MKKIIVLPTYLITMLFIWIWPNTHPFGESPVSLKDWAQSSTNLNIAFSVYFWLQIIWIILFLRLKT
ncbi:hypothetical protein CLW00_101224 [Mongoliibacter ruber]|uniref:Uncharacterized protein n=1 Tax=Mongoliibacter ruber TaxID=1750599 RepID=A0A2T0WV37_9BACT|nr:hypothetical protein CLW00_101224 [Mongoliibacter ruber]